MKKNLRPWGKLELALAYTDGTMSDRAALNWLNEELNHYPSAPSRYCWISGIMRNNSKFYFIKPLNKKKGPSSDGPFSLY